MAAGNLGDDIRKALLKSQRNEITEHIIYGRLARSEKDPRNARVLGRIAGDELRHYKVWKGLTGEDAGPYRLKAVRYYLMAKVLGLTFGIKLMEMGEGHAQDFYRMISRSVPAAARIERDENAHEKKLIAMVDEERLRYVGSIVLGLNDALVEFTGALAGFSFALQSGAVVAMAGLITGIAASLSMGASEYLSTKSEKGGEGKKPGKAAVYTTITYILTVLMMVAPFMLLQNVLLALGATISIVILLILFFTFYTSVAQDLPFRRRFAEMITISLGVAGASFLIGMLVKAFLGVGA